MLDRVDQGANNRLHEFNIFQLIAPYCTNLENLEISKGRNSIFLTVYFELL